MVRFSINAKVSAYLSSELFVTNWMDSILWCPTIRQSMGDWSQYEAFVYSGVEPNQDTEGLVVERVDEETFDELLELGIISTWSMWDGFDREKGIAVGGRMGYVESESDLREVLSDD